MYIEDINDAKIVFPSESKIENLECHTMNVNDSYDILYRFTRIAIKPSSRGI